MRNSMDIKSKPGTIVYGMFEDGVIINGYDSDKDHAMKYIKPETPYTVDHVDVHSWISTVYFKELGHIGFNTVHFENRYSNLEKENIELKKSMAEIAVNVGISKSEINNTILWATEKAIEVKSLQAINADLLKENQELKDALKSIKALIDDNTLVRNTKDDGLEGFAVRQLPLITALAKMQRALNKHEAQ